MLLPLSPPHPAPPHSPLCTAPALLPLTPAHKQPDNSSCKVNIYQIASECLVFVLLDSRDPLPLGPSEHSPVPRAGPAHEQGPTAATGGRQDADTASRPGELLDRMPPHPVSILVLCPPQRSAPTVRIPGSQNGTPVTYKWRTERLK